MFAKVLLRLILSVAVALACAIEYPAGVDPAVCPNYPFCDAGVLARFSLDGAPIPEWGLPALSLPPVVQAIPEVTIADHGAPQYPADFDAALCPNYPYCY